MCTRSGAHRCRYTTVPLSQPARRGTAPTTSPPPPQAVSRNDDNDDDDDDEDEDDDHDDDDDDNDDDDDDNNVNFLVKIVNFEGVDSGNFIDF